MVRNIERTFSSKAKSHSVSVASSSVPWCTKPAQLNRMSTGPASSAARMMSPACSTSSFAARMRSEAISCTSASFTSVAMTVAPSAAKASAVARPMPWPAAVTKAVLSARRSDIAHSLAWSGAPGWVRCQPGQMLYEVPRR